MNISEIANSQQNIKSSMYFKTNLYTSGNCRIPSFEAGKNFVTLPNRTVKFPKMIMSKQEIIIVPKMTIGTIIKQLLNIFRVHKTGNISEFSTIDSPIGKINLTKKGIEQYFDVINLYAGGYPNQECYAPDKTKVIKAQQIINVIKGNGEYYDPVDNMVETIFQNIVENTHNSRFLLNGAEPKIGEIYAS